MTFIDIIAAFFAAAAWTGTLVLLWLFRRKDQGFPLLHRYVRWKFVAWTCLIGLQSLTYTLGDREMAQGWLTSTTLYTLRVLSFRGIMAYATWQLIRDLLMPHLVPAIAKAEAHVQMDTQGRIVGWNAEAEALFGWTAQEVVGEELASVLIPERMRDFHRAGVDTYRLTGEAPLVDSRYTQLALRKDGSSFLIDISLTAHVTSRGTIFLGTCVPARIL